MLQEDNFVKYVYKSLYDTLGSHKNDISGLWDFYKNMSVGDIVFVKSGIKKIVGYGEIVGEYYYDANFEYCHKHNVNWKSFVEYDLPMNLNQKTLTGLKDDDEIKLYLMDLYENIDDKKVVDNEDNNLIKEYLGNNTIFYGVPGCGKSYQIKKLLKSVPDENVVRILFHPEYTYSDFVGQIIPVTEDGKITYNFVPGPFTEILKQANIKKNEDFYLIIEEINRGNAPAIFGDLFQLLDRKDGESEYKINNKDIAKIVYLDENKKVYIPKNLTIFATMNTCDQNVFTIDTAFKRRWRMKRIKNDFDCAEDILGKKISFENGVSFTWKEFATRVNDVIMRIDSIMSVEDKQMGVFFVKDKDFEDVRIFAEKVLMYLWDDVVRFDKSQLFNSKYKTLDSVIDEFVSGYNVFNLNHEELVLLYAINLGS